MRDKIRPIFVFCLPRSGSTLLQRILMGHSKISSIAEPHFLLPFIFASKKDGTIAKYSHQATFKGFNDMISYLPGKENEYNQFLNDFSNKIYRGLSDKESIYFLDKTPRYFWIIPEIVKIFPDAKFVFLFRNPLQIYASILTTFSNKRFNNIHGFYRYLTEGIELLSEGYKLLKSNSYKLNYEDLVLNPEKIIKELTDYLDLDYEEGLSKIFKDQAIKGGSKDPTGIRMYNKVDSSPLNKWKELFNTPYRKRIIKRYVDNLNEEALRIQGYDKENILKDIEQIEPKGKYSLIQDFIDYTRMKLVLKFKLNIFFSKNLRWVKHQYLN